MDTCKWRQGLHLEPPRGWLNDPNGLCRFGGKYHVYFQYAPDDVNGGVKKCWGHYESPDFLKWDFVGTPLKPDIPEDRDGVYSGSAIVKDGTLHLFYTGNVKEKGDYDYILNGRGANVIHVTTEDGRSYSEKKVVLRNSDYPNYCSCHVRDPKLWKENGRYYMVLGARTRSHEGCVMIYESSDLESWSYVKRLDVPNFGYMWECPDIFTVNGRKYLGISPQGLVHRDTKYQNIFNSGYFRMNGDELTDFEEWDQGFDFYAPQTFEASDGRRLLIGWMGIGDPEYSNATAELGWQHCLTLPRELTAADNGAILQNPIRELEALRGEKSVLTDNESRTAELPFELFGKVSGNFEIIIDNALKLSNDGKIFKLEFTDNTAGCGRTVRKAEISDCKDVRIIADMSSLEIYLDGGRRALSTRFYPVNDFVKLSLRGLSADIYPLKNMEVNILGE